MNIWKGKNFGQTGILILGESTYGADDALSDYIEDWINKRLPKPDQTFSRIFKACTGLDASTATIQQRRNFWDLVGYYNFVPGSVDATNHQKATAKHFAEGRLALPGVLQELKPRGVWILGRTQAEHSRPIVETENTPCEVVTHPTCRRGVTAETLRDWKRRSKSAAEVACVTGAVTG